MKQLLTIISISILLASCKGNSQTSESKAKSNPQTTKMLTAFNTQKHRLEFNGCQMQYNNKPFHLGMTLGEFTDVLGDYNYFYSGAIIYEKLGLVLGIGKQQLLPTSKPSAIYIYMNTQVSEENKELLKHELNIKKDYFSVEGMPVDKNMRVMDFFENSEFGLDDFRITNYGYELDYGCDSKKMRYHFEANGVWLRKGGGHLTFKDRPNDKNEFQFKKLYITEINE